MARISKYILDESLSDKDKLVGSSYVGTVNGVDEFKTRNFTIGQIKASIGVSSYTHIQDTPAQVWNVQHNLSAYPSVTVALPTGQVGQADITYIDNNNLTITFAGDESGKAYLN